LFQVISITKYKEWVERHLKSSAKEIDIKRIVELFELATKVQEKHSYILSEKENTFLKNTPHQKYPNPKTNNQRS